jgi:hypothetical protein
MNLTFEQIEARRAYARQYYKTHRAERAAYYKRAVQRRVERHGETYAHAYNEATQAHADQKHRRWEDTDDLVLLRSNLPNREKAALLGRTLAGVHTRLHVLRQQEQDNKPSS